MNHNLAIRMSPLALDFETILTYVSPIPLFSSGAEAAEHGKVGIDDPEIDARIAIDKLERLKKAKGDKWRTK